MNLTQLRSYMEEQFVDDYTEIHKFMENVNETLDQIGIINKYDSYNDFCMDIEANVFNLMDQMAEPFISPTIMIKALNNMVKYKILKDETYEAKVKSYFTNAESVLEDINYLKVSGITS